MADLSSRYESYSLAASQLAFKYVRVSSLASQKRQPSSA